MMSNITGDGIPEAAKAIGLNERFLYWRGASGKRYLFTAIAIESIDDFREAVVLFVSNARKRAPKVLWIGAVDDGGIEKAARLRRRKRGMPIRQAFIHLLASDADERRAVIDDLAAAL